MPTKNFVDRSSEQFFEVRTGFKAVCWIFHKLNKVQSIAQIVSIFVKYNLANVEMKLKTH